MTIPAVSTVMPACLSVVQPRSRSRSRAMLGSREPATTTSAATTSVAGKAVDRKQNEGTKNETHKERNVAKEKHASCR
eukprot:scaffold5360_cov118-Isochrysis_galbana.AAC.11